MVRLLLSHDGYPLTAASDGSPLTVNVKKIKKNNRMIDKCINSSIQYLSYYIV